MEFIGNIDIKKNKYKCEETIGAQVKKHLFK